MGWLFRQRINWVYTPEMPIKHSRLWNVKFASELGLDVYSLIGEYSPCKDPNFILILSRLGL